ncbi:MAG: hypothetical protein M1820_005491 [Bogoriella megaspora]|nr:MAG: hypothetical protein M1820_005491 [Bogoriella megaspora]
MAPKKRKTKPAANPARGFATTSISSKPKPDEPNPALQTPEPIKSDIVENPDSNQSNSVVVNDGKDSHQLNQLTPDELEKELERSELQLFIEKHGAKHRQNASRATSKLFTDKRVLRGQASFLPTKEWLTDEIATSAMNLIHDDHDEINADDSPRKDTTLAEEEFLVKLWSLREILLQVGFNTQHVENAVGKLVRFSSSIDSNASTWGLAEALEYLAITCDEADIPAYAQHAPKSSDVSRASSRPGTPTLPPETQAAFFSSHQENHFKATPDNKTSGYQQYLESEDSGSSLESETDSDLDPEQLMSTYLAVKARLYQRRPNLFDKTSLGKTKKAMRSQDQGPEDKPLTPAIKRLQQKLQRIESDVLFDQKQADELWTSKQVNLARENAARRRLRLDEKTNSASTSRDSSMPRTASAITNNLHSGEVSPKREPKDNATEVLKEAELLGDDILGGMFDVLPEQGVLPTSNGSPDPNTSLVTIRDFGKVTGLSPKRILEEACRARDSSVKLDYKHVSPTTYSSRHAVSIKWSKDQDIPNATAIPAVHCAANSQSLVVTMISVATPDLAQSESYVATAALFIVFSGSPKEEKAHLRLPPAWRDLWSKFATHKQDISDAKDREDVSSLRELIRKHQAQEDEEDEDVILTSAFRRRAQITESGANSPVPERDTNALSSELKELWKRKISTPSYHQMLAGRSTLPIAGFRDEALATIERNQVTIICGETGCGKSTQLPAYLLEHQLSQGKDCKIYCTQPRRISAISLAQRVSEELGEYRNDCGTSRSLVGYAIRLESQTTPSTRLIYATVGIVLRMFESASGIQDITHLIIDEVHERSIDTDFLLILLRSLLLKRPDLKVVLMSATVDADRFSRYLDNAPTLNVPGRTFPVHTKFLEDAIALTGYNPLDSGQDATDDTSDDVEDAASGARTGQELVGYSKATINTVRNFDEYRVDYGLIIALLEKVAYDPSFAKYSKAVLVFLPGIAEIRKLNDMLSGHPSFMKGWIIHPLHSTISSEEQQQAFLIPPRGTRKIVLSTNITETSVTIPDITCVIDTAKHKEMRFDERRQLSRLLQAFISRANAKQRRGRAGRVQEGLCFHLITKHRHDNIIAPQQTPEMLRLSLQELCMRVKICKLGDIETALSEALDPPSAKNIRRAIDALVDVNALTATEQLTDLGKQLAKLPLDAHLGKLVILSAIHSTLDPCLTIAAILSSKSPFVTPLNQKSRADSIRLGFKKADSDLLTAYNAYCAWRRVCQNPTTAAGGSEFQFCKRNFLSPQTLAGIEDLKAQLLGSLVDAGFVSLDASERTLFNRFRSGGRQRSFVPELTKYNENSENDAFVTSVIAWSFYPKLLAREGKGWRNVANNQTVSLHPTSVNKTASQQIKYLSFYSIMQSSSRFTNAQETSPVPEIALVLGAGDADFKLYAGVVVIDGQRMRFKVDSWKVLVILKKMRERMKDIVERRLKKPGVRLPERLEKWAVLWRRVMAGEGRRVT